MIQLRLSQRGNLKVDLLPAEGDQILGSIRLGEQRADGTCEIGPWQEARPKVIVKAPQAGTSLRLRCEDPGIRWRSEVLVPLDAPWKAFAFRMEQPKP